MDQITDVEAAFFEWLARQSIRLDNMGQAARFVMELKTVTFCGLAKALDALEEADPGCQESVMQLIADLDCALQKFTAEQA